MIKKFILSGLMVLALGVANVNAQVDIFFSTSAVDANAGSVLDLANVGDSGSLYVWVTNNDSAAVDGLGIDILSADPSILEGVSHNIENPNSRWFAASPGNVGDLVTGSNSFVLITETGIANDGVATLHSTINFDATALGTTDVSVAANNFGVTVGGVLTNNVNFGNATVSVGVIPEPSALGVLLIAGIGFVSRRRR